MSFWKFLGWSVILNWLFNRRNGNKGGSNGGRHTTGWDTYDPHKKVEDLNDRIYAAQTELDSMEDQLYGMVNEDSEEYDEFLDRIDELQNDIFDMEDELDEDF